MRAIDAMELEDVSGGGKGWWFVAAEYVYEAATSFADGFADGAKEPVTLDGAFNENGGGGGR